jgi:sensor histidine kinase YesM
MLIVVSIAVAIVFFNIYLDGLLNIRQLVDAAFHKSGPPRHRKGRDHGWDFTIFAIIALVIGAGTSITATQKWQKDKQKREELEKDKVTSELSFLKAQINPHFFFNTLNNIYALTQVDANVAGKAIHQLSRMMRYLIYDTQQGHTMLSQELAFVKDYISLMQLRLTDVVTINVDEPPVLKDMPLAPMIFLPFVENAFKHGVSATQKSYIDIIILQKDNMLDLTVKNSIINDNSISLDTNSGIGLVNTRRRLDLLYPGKYKLDINESKAGNEYTVHLTIDLS